jgi:hypothetical protein
MVEKLVPRISPIRKTIAQMRRRMRTPTRRNVDQLGRGASPLAMTITRVNQGAKHPRSQW